MSTFAATQIAKPSDEQEFERANIPLWQGLLGDPNVQRNGRRGQRQNGVDLYGYRNRDPNQLVGIQCKLKGHGQELSEKEVIDEFSKALTFKPPLVEYFIVTTSDDNGRLHELARMLVADQAAKGRVISFHVWGWNTLEERIKEHVDAIKAFDPTYGAYARQTWGKIDDLEATVISGFSSLAYRIESLSVINHLSTPDDVSPPHWSEQSAARGD